ncbi:MAG: glycosyltransferase family 2 protein [Lachnospiraceae bacterium]|nr:glycosyltransferase family 2 protein [Lachnospiraceae bacterium]
MATISLCMIVKNEEKVLKRCLDSFRAVADEIVIVDTGSLDSTKEIAAAYTDKVYDFKWVDDFSEARNFAFSKTSMEYIYSADADEVLDEENAKKFLALKEALLPEVEIVQMLYVNRHSYRTTENFEKDLRPKLYRRVRKFTWIDPVHETVRLDPVVFDSDIEILHMPEEHHHKRDFGIFLKMTEALDGEMKPLSKKMHHMYAQELMLSGDAKDFAAAAPYFENAFRDTALDRDMRTECCCVLAKNAAASGKTEEFFKWCLKNISIEPCSEICMELGHHYFDMGDYEEASIWFLNAAQETKPALKADAGGRDAYDMLAHVYEKIAGNYPDIKEQALKMATEYKLKGSHV